jgi:arabinoxylan arabinofuranohydrolase
MKATTLFLGALLMLSACGGAHKTQSVNPGSTFTNPVIFADVPDTDVIRVGSDFYMVSTTMHLMPGVPVMYSRDLVNWRIISYVVPELKDGPAYDLEEGNVYGQGQWASSIRHHDGRFYVFFATNRPQKTYIFSATNPAGEWTKVMDLDERLHDTSLLFDDDGRVYTAGGGGGVRLRELRSDLTGLKEGGLDTMLFRGPDRGLEGLLEGSHIQKIDGRYYIFMIWWPRGGIRTQLAFRSESLAGPYEHRVILSDTLDLARAGVAQGNIVDTDDGRWYGMLFQDHGAVGRVPVLMPCRWVDGWPMLGDENGKVPKVMEKPVQGESETPLVVSDDFGSPTLGLTWEWNHNPDNSLWSLSERKGFMRLKTGKTTQSIFEARNTLSQRTEGRKCSGAVALDVNNMLEGDVAGLAAYCSEPGIIQVVVEGGRKFIVMKDREEEKERVPLAKNRVYLRLDCDFSDGVDTATFHYSINGRKWTRLGTDFKMVYNLSHFMGNRFAIFNYATRTPGGWIDVDSFEYSRIPETI